MPNLYARSAALAFLVAVGWWCTAQAAPLLRPRHSSIVVTAADIEKYKGELEALAGAKAVEQSTSKLIDVQAHWAVYVFTKQGHPAHPAVFVLHAEEEHKGISKVRAWGHTAGNQEAFAEYLAPCLARFRARKGPINRSGYVNTRPDAPRSRTGLIAQGFTGLSGRQPQVPSAPARQKATFAHAT